MYTRLGRPGLVAVGSLFVAVGAVLVLQTLQAERVQRLRLEAYRAKKAEPPDFDREFRMLTAATRIAPDNADVRVELGQEYLNAWEGQVRLRKDVAARPLLAAGTIAAAALDPLAHARVLVWSELKRAPQGAAKALAEDLELPGLREMITARNICPLLPRPHMRLAAHASALAEHDPPAKYWERARRLAPYDAELWYFSGVESRKQGQKEAAWDQWKRSLIIQRKYLPQIVDAAVAAGMSPADMLTRFLPEDPRVLYEAAVRLEPDPDSAEKTRPFWEKVIELLKTREGPGPSEFYVKANALRRLDQSDAAIMAYRQAVDMHFQGKDWREEYARYLDAIGKYEDALRQISYIEGQGGLTPRLKQFKEVLEQEIHLMNQRPTG